MKEEIKKLIKSAKIIAGANLVSLLFSGVVAAKNFSEQECKERYEGKPLSSNVDFTSDNGCECDEIEVENAPTERPVFIQKNCRVLKKYSDKECREKFERTVMDRAGFPGFKGCVCEHVFGISDDEGELYEIQSKCRAQTEEEKAFIKLRNKFGYDCIKETPFDMTPEVSMKLEACKILANLKCANIDKQNNGLSREEYFRILQNAKECHVPADRLIKQVIKSQSR